MLVVDVTDDGTGIDPTAGRSGLRNLEERAKACGGSLNVAAVQPHGTRLTWRVPLDGRERGPKDPVRAITRR